MFDFLNILINCGYVSLFLGKKYIINYYEVNLTNGMINTKKEGECM